MIPSSFRRQLKSESGQSVILISMVILSFLMFFSFAINTGVLITAKISVQSAADAAAYAGASTQARQLNAISFLNYDMRRQYKKFVYRYAFMGSIASKNFPNETVGNTAGHYGYAKDYYPTSDSAPIEIPLKVPVVCIPITSDSTQSDNCVTLNLPSTVAQINSFFPDGGLTMVTQQLLQTTSQIQAMQQEQCGKTSTSNLFVLIEWLMRGNPGPAAIEVTLNQMMSSGNLSAQDKQKLTNILSNLVKGLGLYPRNIINLMRIETLEKFLNSPSLKDVRKETVDSLEQTQDAEIHERTIQAFRSALTNLNNEVLAHDSLTLQELQNDHQITINPVKASFNAYVQYLKDSGVPGPNDETICNSKIIPFQARSTPVGVVRAPGPPVHYAVKLTAKAKLLFLPIKDGIELEAFASAKPFGSRIGPANLTETDFVENIPPTPIGADVINDCSDPVLKCNIPNLKIVGAETYLSPAYLKDLGQLGIVINPPSGSGGLPGKTYTFQGMPNAIAPQPAEIGRYNILPPPQNADAMAFEFIPYASDQNSKIFRFYAPIYTGGGDPIQKITAFMDEVFGLTQVAGTGAFGGVDMMALKATLQAEMINYVNGPMEAGGNLSEHGETTTFAALELPLAPPLPPENPVAPHPQKFWLTTANEVLSSWGPEYGRNSSGIGFKPRFGYSVKFVAMQNLLQSGMNESDSDEAKVNH